MLQCWAKMPTDRPTFEALKDFLAETIPIVVRAREGLEEEGRMRIEPGDALVVIDGRSENFWWKGQNQRTFEVGLFPRKIVEDSQGKKIKDISKPLKNSFIHTGHGSHNGRSWGKAEAIDDLYLRSPMQPPDLTGIGNGNQDERKLPGRSSMKMKNNPIVPESIKQTHQFNYGRLEDEGRGKEQDGSSKNTIRPHRPAPGWNGDGVQAYKSLPDLQKAYEDQNTFLHTREDSLIDLSPAETMSRVYANTGLENNLGAQSVTSLIDEDIPSTNSNRNVYQNQNYDFQNGFQDRLNESNASFSSLPEGETYHVPPDEDDPFDTSSVILNSTSRLSDYKDQSRTNTGLSYTNAEYKTNRYDSNQGYPDLSVSGSADEYETKPSIISQLLASTSKAVETPDVVTITPTLQLSSTPEPSRYSETFNSLHDDRNRHRRAVSTIAEADLFLPPLTSPFSPPAFNPYDIVLGSNEAIAGLDSPAPYQSNDKPKRQTQLNSSEAFSWLNDKIGDMKISQKTDRNVFQFPSVSEVQPTPEDLYATIKKRPSIEKEKVDKYSKEETNQTHQHYQSQVDSVYNSVQDNSSSQSTKSNKGAIFNQGTNNNQVSSSYQGATSNQGSGSDRDSGNKIFKLSKSDAWIQNFQTEPEPQKSIENENQGWNDKTSNKSEIYSSFSDQQQSQSISYQSEQIQRNQQIQQQKLHQQQLQQELQQQQQQQERQRQQLLQQQRIQQEQEIQHQRNLYQQQLNLQNQIFQQNQLLEREKEMERKNLEKIQQHRLEKERKKSEDEKRRRDELDQRQRELDMQSRLEASGGEVFHFPQFSTLSTTGAPKETYSVDKNFIKDLEKNLGKNESKYFLSLFHL